MQAPPKKPFLGADQKDWALGALLLALSLLARAVFFTRFDARGFFVKYPFFADQVARGADIGERLLDLSPFYLSFWVFLIRDLQPMVYQVVVFQLALGALNCLILYALGLRFFPRPAAFLGALACAWYANLMVLEATFEPLVFVLFFNLACLWFLVLAAKPGLFPARRAVWTALAGFFAGLSIITKPNFLLFLPLAGVWFFLCLKPGLRTAAASFALMLVCVSLVVFPVTWRNWNRFHDVVLVTADFGKVFFHGNAGEADGFLSQTLPATNFDENGRMDPDHAHVVFRQYARHNTGKDLTPSQTSRYWVEQTLRDMGHRPVKAASTFLKKGILFFHHYERHLIDPAGRLYRQTRGTFFPTYGILASLGLLGAWAARKRWKELFLAYGMVFVYLASGVLLVVSSRYRAPAAPFLCLFAGQAILDMGGMARQKQWRRLLAWTLALLGLLAMSYGMFPAQVAALNILQSNT